MFYLFDVEKQRYDTNHLTEKVAIWTDLPNILCFFYVFLYQHVRSLWLTIDYISFPRIAIEKNWQPSRVRNCGGVQFHAKAPFTHFWRSLRYRLPRSGGESMVSEMTISRWKGQSFAFMIVFHVVTFLQGFSKPPRSSENLYRINHSNNFSSETWDDDENWARRRRKPDTFPQNKLFQWTIRIALMKKSGKVE
jgi:hypothetical protein